MTRSALSAAAALAILPAIAAPNAALAQSDSSQISAIPYADLADLATAAPMVVVVKVKKAVELDKDRTGPVREGWTRAYVEAETERLLAGNSPIGGKIKYLADVKLDSRGRMPNFKKSTMVLFARPVAGRPGEIQLVAPDGQVPIGLVGEERLRGLLQQTLSADAAPEVTGVRDALHTPGNLAGEGETQIFLETADGEPASIAVLTRPGQPPRWGLSLGELVNPDAGPPAPNTLAWYRLACALPQQLPASAQIATDPAMRAAAARDYALVVRQLGACGRQRVF
ncbi:hypothetical protein [Croceicoccus naphthovorans]|uniref:hypothetical protein n=1 Tax=Croceicoccus naphthovorans TaxID=1348774 RepID=UPI00182A6E1B|nr:hypothetical protein [Croceicoccus naphthovorans]MBB3989079.1 hypothetical protein [Croceicoccus naphthovorans]